MVADEDLNATPGGFFCTELNHNKTINQMASA